MVILVACSTSTKEVKQSAGNLPFYNSPDFTPQWISKEESGYHTIHTIPNFKFTNQMGETISEQTFSGKIYVADFFFTSCPGICKRLTSNLRIVQDSFKNDQKVLLLSHSVNPETDSVTILHHYAETFGVIQNKWHLVTGPRDSLYTIARKAYFADEDLGMKKNSNDFLHTENMLLIDTHRRIRGVYKGTSINDIQNLIADIRQLEKEE